MQNKELKQDATVQSRAIEKLVRDLGPEFIKIFEDPNLIEIMLNPNGKLFYERFGEKIIEFGYMSPTRSKNIIELIAGYHAKVITKNVPFLECEFPLDGSRFSATISPVTLGASFTLRKKASKIFTLEEYVMSGVMSEKYADIIRAAIRNHKNILIIGGTGSGKTTLVNALIHEISLTYPDERIVIIEDTGEIQCSSTNVVQFHTTIDVSMTQLLRLTLRYRPDRILVGEVRGPEALDLLDSWNTGHEGGLATLHANSTEAGLTRLRSLISRNPFAPKDIEPLISEAVHFVIQISKTSVGRKVTEMLEVKGYKNGEYVTEVIY